VWFSSRNPTGGRKWAEVKKIGKNNQKFSEEFVVCCCCFSLFSRLLGFSFNFLFLFYRGVI
jgi:hypothetical protein